MFEAKLGSYVVAMTLGCAYTDKQQFTDLPVSVALGNQFQNLTFPMGQGIGCGFVVSSTNTDNFRGVFLGQFGRQKSLPVADLSDGLQQLFASIFF